MKKYQHRETLFPDELTIHIRGEVLAQGLRLWHVYREQSKWILKLLCGWGCSKKQFWDALTFSWIINNTFTIIKQWSVKTGSMHFKLHANNSSEITVELKRAFKYAFLKMKPKAWEIYPSSTYHWSYMWAVILQICLSVCCKCIVHSHYLRIHLLLRAWLLAGGGVTGGAGV